MHCTGQAYRLSMPNAWSSDMFREGWGPRVTLSQIGSEAPHALTAGTDIPTLGPDVAPLTHPN